MFTGMLQELRFCGGQFSNKPGWTQSHDLWKMFLTCLSICLPGLVKFSNKDHDLLCMTKEFLIDVSWDLKNEWWVVCMAHPSLTAVCSLRKDRPWKVLTRGRMKVAWRWAWRGRGAHLLYLHWSEKASSPPDIQAHT